jgi:hypothetical protein
LTSFRNLIVPSITNTYYGSFNGSTQSLNSPASAATTIGSGDVTFEAYIYPTSFAASACPIFVQGGTGGFWVGKNASNFVLRAYGVSDQLQYATLPDLNKWTHIAIVRSGGTVTLYYNGNAVASVTSLYNFTNFTNYIGADGATAYFSGRISNLRLVKGSALYTANFTPPAAPLTAVSGTALLTLQDATIKDNSSNAFTITNTGSVTTTSIPVTSLPPYTLYSANYLVVAGGGGGGATNIGGGGGAGGLLSGALNLVIGITYTATVGAGGAGGIYATNRAGFSGGNSVFSSITTTGGGGGGADNGGAGSVALNGGSGGGTGYNTNANPGTGISGQGFAGGKSSGVLYGGGGGGGSGSVGANASVLATPGNGGSGTASSITGSSVTYAGGGGGGNYSGNVSGIGGVGAAGGGNGGYGASGTAAGVNATINTGSGGGGAGSDAVVNGGSGGSGVVIISVPSANYTGTVTGAPTVTTSGGNTIMTFTQSGSYTA